MLVNSLNTKSKIWWKSLFTKFCKKTKNTEIWASIFPKSVQSLYAGYIVHTSYRIPEYFYAVIIVVFVLLSSNLIFIGYRFEERKLKIRYYIYFKRMFYLLLQQNYPLLRNTLSNTCRACIALQWIFKLSTKIKKRFNK